MSPDTKEIEFHEYHSAISGQRFTWPDGQEAVFFGGFLTIRADLMYYPVDKNGNALSPEPCYKYLDAIIGKQPHITKLINGNKSGALEVLHAVDIKGVTEQANNSADAQLQQIAGANLQIKEDLTTGPDPELTKAFNKATNDSLSEAELKSSELVQSPAAIAAADRIAAIRAERSSRTQG